MNSGYLTLPQLLAVGRPPTQTVTTHADGRMLDWSQWTRLIAALQQSLAEHAGSSSPHASWAVYCEDASLAGAALFALWHRGQVAWLPGNTTPETIAALDHEVAGWISDRPIDTGKPVIVPHLDEETIGAAATQPTLGITWGVLPADNAMLYVFTSGSTGEPKAIPKKLSQLQSEIDNLQALWGDSLSHTRLMSSVSHQHVYGLLFRLLWPLCNATVFVNEAIQYPEQWFALTRQWEHVTWVASPALYKRMQPLLPWSELAGRVTKMFCSGGPLPRDNADFLAGQLQQAVVEVFGSSETGGVGWREAPPTDNAWTTFQGMGLSVSNEGALLITSPYLPDTTPYAMGDRAELLNNGQFRLQGRLDRIVKIEEKRVSLPQLEHHLLQHPWVKEAHLLALAPPNGRQALGAVVVLREDFPFIEAANRKQLVETLRAHMALLCEAIIIPKKWRFVPEIPMTAQGKRTNDLLLPLFATEHRPLLPEILVRESVSALETRFVLNVPARLAYFDGHFRQAPILPGVVQVDWAVKLGQSCWTIPGEFTDLEVLKFQRVVTPLQLLQLSLRHDPAKQKLYFQIQSNKGQHASGRVVFQSNATGSQEGA